MEQITVGTSNNIVLDATLSVDKDNTGEEMQVMADVSFNMAFYYIYIYHFG